MARRLFPLLSALSLLLCAAVVVLWPLSHAVPLVLARMTATGHLYSGWASGGSGA